ncbi:MAG: hypothetical protein A2Z97_15310 [Bdellovibrionales bacterium GWB1_52_6]|nr:MAG: hypothetical protein A2Z97_15310 [Bdellovibrionales bacterium GWB1_52_6]OFZ05949.1 MAG: hypothetical protein A2X97_01255 [Bdellovibrionales bacterium GWA1_52_35]HCM39433.1 hypothetical protein [Bdellovibrionales bacterium]
MTHRVMMLHQFFHYSAFLSLFLASAAQAATQSSGVLEIVGRVPETAIVTYNADGTSRVVSNFPIQVHEGCTNTSLRAGAVDMICDPGVRPTVISD